MGGRVHEDGAARADIGELLVVQVDVVGHAEDRHAVAEVVDVSAAEGLLPGHRVQPVRADHQVECPGHTAGQRDIDPVLGLAQVGDRVAPAVLDAVSCREKQAVQVAAQDLGIAVRASAEGVAVHARHAASLGVDDRAGSHIGDPCTDLVEQAHLLDHG